MNLRELCESPDQYYQVASSWVREIGWDAGDLHVRLLDGKEYVYSQFEEDKLDDFLQWGSPGNFMNYEVKPFYDYQRIR